MLPGTVLGTSHCISQELRERLLAKSREQDGERLAKHTRQLEELPVGTPVIIQNQTGRYPTKWDKTGVIVEIKPHSQLVIKVDGSRRLTLRNRRFVKKLITGGNNHDDKSHKKNQELPLPPPSPVPTPSQSPRRDPVPPPPPRGPILLRGFGSMTRKWKGP